MDDLRVAAVATPQSTSDQVAESGGGDSGSAACTGGGDRIGGIGNFASKFAFWESGPSTAISVFFPAARRAIAPIVAPPLEQQSVAERKTATDPGGGGGFAAWISNNV